MAQEPREKSLIIKGKPDSGVGKILIYLQGQALEAREMARQTMVGRFLPFILDRNDPQFQTLAIRCAEECESWARTIRQYASIPNPQASEKGEPYQGSYAHNGHESYSSNRESEQPEKLEKPREQNEAERRRQGQLEGDDVIKRMGLDFGSSSHGA